MKIAKRVVSGLLGTIALTSFILYAINIYHTDHSGSHLKSPEDSENTEQITPSSQTAGRESDADLSIDFSERNIVYQSQEAADTLTDENSGQSSPKDSQADENPDQSSPKDSQTDASSETDSGKDTSIKQTDTSETDTEKKNGQATEKKKKKKKNSDTDKSYTFQTVSEDYFSDALFIGDSRTVGMQQSGLLPDAAYYAQTGIGIGEILSKRIVNEGGYLISVRDALSRHSFGKVYIMIGINDMSMGDTDWFLEQYTEILNTVRQTQPDAVIYIQGNIPMSYSTQDLHGSLNNQNLKLRDEASSTLADSKTVFYLDVNTLYADANGHLASMYTTDGLHIKSNYYPIWVDYLKHRAIVR